MRSVLAMHGDIARAIAQQIHAELTHRRLAELAPAQHWLYGRTLAATGNVEEARRIAALIEEGESNAWTTFGLGALYATLGDRDRAFYWLQHEPQHAWIGAIGRSHWFAGLRGDPRLDEMIEELGLYRP